MAGWLRLHLEAALDLLWPPLCPACGARAERPREHFCETCWSALRTVRPGRDALAPGTPPVVAAFSVDALFLAMLAASKYGRFRAVGRRLAWEAVSALTGRMPEGTLVPVPLTASKRRERGFNQTEDFAAALAEASGLPLRAEWLRRRRGGAALAGRARDERVEAVRGAFAAGRRFPGPAAGPLILVDDVVTTGATSSACAAAMRQARGKVTAVVAMGRAFAPAEDVAPPDRSFLGRL